ncbi:MAG TPA: S-adenosyl-l-methionine hydroxide adenosyltransferase family protein [Chthoniobacterales bacterium]
MSGRLSRTFLVVCLSFVSTFSAFSQPWQPARPLVFQTDFGLKDGAVSAMKGVAFQVNSELRMFDLTHEIPAYNIWEAAFRLKQTVPYWPAGTVFVSVVDPGVGTARKSVVAKLATGQFVVTPDNGTLTFLAEHPGIEELRQIDEGKNRLPGSEKSFTFHGRDVYAYTGARLAAGVIGFEGVGPILKEPGEPVKLPYQQPSEKDGVLKGNIPILDAQYGNAWTNIDDALFQRLTPKKGDIFTVTIRYEGKEIYKGEMPYVASFGDVPEGKPLLYLNSLLEISFAVNMGNFSAQNGVQSGPEWSVEISRATSKSGS